MQFSCYAQIAEPGDYQRAWNTNEYVLNYSWHMYKPRSPGLVATQIAPQERRTSWVATHYYLRTSLKKVARTLTQFQTILLQLSRAVSISAFF